MNNPSSFLVTGASGFIGSHLCEALIAQGHRVFGIDNFDPYYDAALKRENLRFLKSNASFTFIEGSYGDYHVLQALRDQPIEVVFHLGARPGTRSSLTEATFYKENNVKETARMLFFLNRLIPGAHYIFASSSSVYGRSTGTAFAESAKLGAPLNPYAETKVNGEILFERFSTANGSRVRILRFFSVYGPRQRPDLAFSKFAKAILTNNTIRVFGEAAYRDFTYIDDIISGMLGALKHVRTSTSLCDTFNLGSGRKVKVTETLQLLMNYMGASAPIQFLPPLAEESEGTLACINKTREALGYEPQTSFEVGLENFVKWFLSRRITPADLHQPQPSQELLP